MHLMCNCAFCLKLSEERHTSYVQAVCKVHSAYFALKSAELFERRRASNVHARAQVHDQSRPWAGHQPGWPYHFPRLLLACLGNFTNMLHGTKSSDWWYGSRFMRISHQQSKSVTLRSTTITRGLPWAVLSILSDRSQLMTREGRRKKGFPAIPGSSLKRDILLAKQSRKCHTMVYKVPIFSSKSVICFETWT